MLHGGRIASSAVSSAVEIARQQWAEGQRKLEGERSNPERHRLLLAQVDVVTAELRRRLGAIFTLRELADEYGRADDWVGGVVADLAPEAAWPPGFAIATDAAFHLYARGARDFTP